MSGYYIMPHVQRLLIISMRGLTLLAAHVTNCAAITCMYSCYNHYISTSSATVRGIYHLGRKYSSALKFFRNDGNKLNESNFCLVTRYTNLLMYPNRILNSPIYPNRLIKFSPIFSLCRVRRKIWTRITSWLDSCWIS